MAQKPEKLLVDITDPRDAEDKLIVAEGILEEKRQAVAQAAEEVQEWADKVKVLRMLSGVSLKVDGDSSSPVQDLVVGIVEREGREMRPAQVAKALREEGHQVASNDAVNAALLAAVNAGRLKKPQQRHYAPRD